MPRECPECEAENVTLDPDEGSILGHPIEHFIFTADDGDELPVTAYCWGCGWEKSMSVSVEVVA